ncbi:phBC6A51 family helix-turn-helix protein [Evansella halocellulosilytica]|uniref:phBC6A51 family helix-turn-helix protein n=1 Tax=Evansella halocellulosilytica TaxID=2011013 RepID=UPI000BB97776|nr:phBC6A51 family helix-turn-helix protein [Evansella halocellulosilytica]
MRKLNEKQLQAIEILSTVHGLEYQEIAAKLGVTDRTLRNWRKDGDFNDELKRAIVRKSADMLPEVMESIPGHIINDGNAAMFRTFLQAHGMLTEKHEVEAVGSPQADIGDIKTKVAHYRKEQ